MDISNRMVRGLIAVLISVSCCHKVSAQTIFNDSVLHEIRFQTEGADWFDTLDKWYYEGLGDAPKKFMRTTITIDGMTLGNDAGIRFKGNYSYTGFSGSKKPIRIHFDKFSKKQKYEGIEKINLHNFAGDPSFLREYISYGLLRHAGIHAPRVAYTRLYINGVYRGVYLIVEEPEDKLFLKTNFGTDKGNLFDNANDTRLEWKGGDPAQYTEMKLQTKEKTGSWTNFLEWVKLFNTDFGNSFHETLRGAFDIAEYLKVLALDVYLNNWDSYADNGRNFFIYDNPATGKLHWIPWDYNLAMWKKNLALFPKDGDSKYQYKPLIWRIHDNDSLRQKYYGVVCGLLNNEIKTYAAAQKTLAIANLIRTAVEEDTAKFYTNEAFYSNRTEAVTVNMQRNHKPTDVLLPGITSLLQARNDTLQAALFSNGCNCRDGKLQQEPETYFSIFPNPVGNAMDISIYDSPEKGHLISALVLDAMGREVMQQTLTTAEGTARMNTTDLPAGIYLLRLTSEQKTTTIKIFKN